MYGLILMTALATGSGTPAVDATPAVVVAPMGCFSSGCYSSGCYGSSCFGAGCYSSGCYSSGCYASSCTGCGGSIFPLFPNLRARASGFLGLRSSCYGSSCYGSSCYGSSCYGSSCFGSSCHGSATFYGSDFHGGCTGCRGIVIGDGIPHVSIPSTEYQAARTSPNASPARLTIEVPAEAKLYVDGQLTKGEGASRNFHTPELPKDQTFFYDLKAEVEVDGKVVTENKRVLVRSGEVLTEVFPKLIAAVKNAQDAVVTKR